MQQPAKRMTGTHGTRGMQGWTRALGFAALFGTASGLSAWSIPTTTSTTKSASTASASDFAPPQQRTRNPVSAKPQGKVTANPVISPAPAPRAADWEFADTTRQEVMSLWGLRNLSIQRLSIEQSTLFVNNDPARGQSIEQLRVQVDLDGDARELVLEPHDLRAQGFRVYAGFGPGANDFAPIDRNFALTTFRGWVEPDAGNDHAGALDPHLTPDPRVVGSYFDGRLRASIHGLLGTPNAASVHRLQPLSEAIPGAEPDVYVIYNDADARGLDGYFCGVGPQHGANIEPAQPGSYQPGFGDRGLPACIRRADVLYDTDYEYTTHFLGRPDQVGEILADVEFINNECDFIFQRDIGAAHFVAGLIVRTDPNDPFSDVTGSSPLLGEFRGVWDGVPLSNPNRDLTHLMTGRDLDGGVIGVAFLPAVCRQDPNVGLSQTFFSAASNRRVLLTAHEMGHQWNAPHDNQTGSACASTPSGFIMNPSIGSQPALFSDCSKDRMTTYLNASNGDCVTLSVLPPQVRPDFDTVYVLDTVSTDPLRNDVSTCSEMTFTLASSTSAQGGSLLVQVGAGPRGRNLVRYTPAPGFTGTDTFTYTPSNDAGAGVAGTVTVLVLPRKGPEFPIRQGSGLEVRYYEWAALLGLLPDFDTIEPYLTTPIGSINFSSSTGNFAGSGRADQVAAVFEGFFNALSTGNYTFFTESDDGSKLFIGDTLVVSNDGTHGMQERSGKIGLLAGRHSFRVEFFDRTDGAGLIARVQEPGQTKQTISSSRLSRRLPCPTDFNADDSIDLLDLLAFLDAWLGTIGTTVPAGQGADINADSAVDLLDLLEFLSLWTAAQCV